ncbi:MAG: DUF975 family protein [Tannerellaceae bacterium]|jgi:uncharacterized membrane protein|nr:DUF975 family protein [Tannerellaceae bacterium]
METRFTVTNVLSASWRALLSQIWILAGLLIGYTILSSILSVVLAPLLVSSSLGGLFLNLLNLVISLMFSLGYLKNIFQTLDGDEPRFSAYGQQARKIGTYFVASLLYGIVILAVAGVTVGPYFYTLHDLAMFKDTVFSPYLLPEVPEGTGWAAFLIMMGAVILLLPAMYLGLRLMFYQACIVDDEGVGILDSLKRSWEMTKGHMLPLFLLALASLGIMIVGFMAFIVGIFVAIPLVYIMYCCAYRRLNPYPEAD